MVRCVPVLLRLVVLLFAMAARSVLAQAPASLPTDDAPALQPVPLRLPERLDGALTFATGNVGWVVLRLRPVGVGRGAGPVSAGLHIITDEASATLTLQGSLDADGQLALAAGDGPPATLIDGISGQALPVAEEMRTLIGLNGKLMAEPSRWRLEGRYRAPTGAVPLSLTGWLQDHPASADNLPTPGVSLFAVPPLVISPEDDPQQRAVALTQLFEETGGGRWAVSVSPIGREALALAVRGPSMAMSLGLDGMTEMLDWTLVDRTPMPSDRAAGDRAAGERAAGERAAGEPVVLWAQPTRQRVGLSLDASGLTPLPGAQAPFPGGEGERFARRMLLRLMAAAGSRALGRR